MCGGATAAWQQSFRLRGYFAAASANLVLLDSSALAVEGVLSSGAGACISFRISSTHLKYHLDAFR